MDTSLSWYDEGERWYEKEECRYYRKGFWYESGVCWIIKKIPDGMI